MKRKEKQIVESIQQLYTISKKSLSCVKKIIFEK